jgi:hypothetical protein
VLRRTQNRLDASWTIIGRAVPPLKGFLEMRRREWLSPWAWFRWLAFGGLLYAGSCSGVNDIVFGSLRLASGIVDAAT